MDEDRVGAGRGVGLAPAERLVQVPAGDQGLDPGDHHEVGVALGVLGGFDPAAELRYGRQLLTARYEAVDLGEALVLDGDGGDTGRFVASDHVHDIVGVAVSGVAVGDHGHADRGRHRPGDAQEFGHGQDVRVGQALGRRDLQTARPDAVEPRAFRQAGAQRVVGAGDAHGAGGVEKGAQSCRAMTRGGPGRGLAMCAVEVVHGIPLCSALCVCRKCR